MKIAAAVVLTVASIMATSVFAQPAPAQHPLSALPYTPSLDVPSMDRTANPCADFYQYSCGGWMASNPIPPDQASWSVYGKVTEENEEYLWGILLEAGKPSADRTPVQQKIGDFFDACTDESHIEDLGRSRCSRCSTRSPA